MDAPELTQPAPEPPVPRRRRFSRRTLLKFVGGAVVLGVGAEAGRVIALTNTHTVVPGRVYRTAQLKADELRALVAEKGIRTVVNLRGVCADSPWYMDECRVTHAAGANQEDVTFSAKRFPAPAEMARLIDILDHTEYPIVLHCQRGADRTGMASAVVKLLQPGTDVGTARRQLWPRYGHFAVGRTAVLDAFFDYYEQWLAARGETHAPDRFRRWVATDYCPGPYRAQLSVLGSTTVSAARGGTVTVRAMNTAVEPWHFAPGRAGGIRLRYSLAAGDTLAYRAQCGQLERTVCPGESIDLVCGVPPLPPGTYAFYADLLDAQPIELLNTDFVQYGSEPLAATVTVS
jgi:protein tyrosine phosphatase (PTP) superfamily phosphohydrolase (DUF442 family)